MFYESIKAKLRNFKNKPQAENLKRTKFDVEKSVNTCTVQSYVFNLIVYNYQF